MSILCKAFSLLQNCGSGSAALSIWHIRAYLFGLEAGLQSLGVRDLSGEAVLARFKCRLVGHSGTLSPYDVIWRRSRSPTESARLFLREWQVSCCDSKVRQPFDSETIGNRTTCAVDIANTLGAIEGRPHMVLAAAEVTQLKALTEGAQFVAEQLGTGKMIPDVTAFEEWLRLRFAPGSSCSWDMVLTSVCGGDGVGAFKEFFQELRRFQSEQHSS